MMYCIIYVLFLVFVWCPCMLAINGSVPYNGGLLPDIILLTLCYCHRGTCSNAMKMFCLCSLWSHLNVLTFPPLTVLNASSVVRRSWLAASSPDSEANDGSTSSRGVWQKIVKQWVYFIVILTQTRMLRAHYRETPKLQAGRSKKRKGDGSKEGRNEEKERKWTRVFQTT